MLLILVVIILGGILNLNRFALTEENESNLIGELKFHPSNI